jgi:chromate reductase
MAYSIVTLVGSLRKESFTLKISNALVKLAPASLKLDVTTLHGLSFFNQDLEANPPADWLALRAKLQASQGVLIVTPEYNRSIPGVLKNAIDWGSRPPNQPFADKPVAIMGASGGLFGSARAQYQLRQMLVFLNCHPVNKPEVMIGQAATKFDESGRLVDEPTRDFIRQLLQALADWTKRLQAGART